MEPEIHQKPIRFYEIDLLRFIAALVVVLFHFTYRGFHADNMSPVEYYFLGRVFKYGFLGVNLFFMISGYVVLMSAQGKTLSQFFVSRVTRLYPAYWVGCTFCFIVVRLFGPAVHEQGWSPWLDAPIRGYLYNMTMLQGFFGVADLDGVYWTLINELVFYFLISLLISFDWLKHLMIVLSIWLGYCILVGPNASGSPFSFLFFPQSAPFFIAGMVLYLLQTSQLARWKLYLLLLLSYILAMRVSLVGLLGIEHTYNESFSKIVVGVIVTLCFLILLLIIYRKINLGQANWLVWAGALTYPVYLLHHNIGYVVLQHFGSEIDKYLLLFAMLIGVFVLAYLVHILVERPLSIIMGDKLRVFLERF